MPGWLQPLPVPERPWQHITMDYQSQPRDSHGYDAVFVVIDRLSKQSFSIPCHKTTTVKDMACLYIQYIYRIWGAPESIVSDCGVTTRSLTVRSGTRGKRECGLGLTFITSVPQAI